jgi:hypothetical protein
MNLLIGLLAVALTANLAGAATNIEVSVPGARVQVGNPPLPPRPLVVERETVIVKEKGDQGKHKGHYKDENHKKKHKKHKGKHD